MLFAYLFVLLAGNSVCFTSCIHISAPIYIESSEGNKCPGNVSFCYNINKFASVSSQFDLSNRCIYVLDGTHLLGKMTLFFKDLQNTTFQGIGNSEQSTDTSIQSSVVIKCVNDTGGIVFQNSNNITFNSLTIINCGTPVKNITSSIAFENVKNINVNTVNIKSGHTLLIVDDGSNETVNTAILENVQFEEVQYGFYFVATACVQYHLHITSMISRNCSGGGLNLDLFNRESDCFESRSTFEATVTILNSLFTSNTAHSGGGVYIVLNDMQFSPIILIEYTNITNNIANNGLGVFLYRATYNSYKSQWNVTLNNVIVEGNIHRSGNNSAAIFADSISALILTNITVANNIATGLFATFTTIVVTENSNSIFLNNSGENGGAIYLSSKSYISFQKRSHLNFTKNFASQKGGAIFQIAENLNNITAYCPFLNYGANLPNSTFASFYGNIANLGGSVLYGGNVNDCEYYAKLFNITEVFNYTGQEGPSVISSNALNVCFCVNDMPDCSMKGVHKSGFSGENINISIATVGQKNGLTTGAIQLETNGEISTVHTDSLKCRIIHQLVPSKDTNISLSIPLSVLGDTTKNITMTVTECPSTLELNNQSICMCGSCLLPSMTCDPRSGKVSRNENAWIGYHISNSTLQVGICPFNYCVSDEVTFNPKSPDADQQCTFNRTGTLCGGCQEGFSLTLGSNKCKECTSSFLVLIIPFAAAGFGLLTLVMVLNLTVSTGTINGLVFFANIVKLDESIFLTNDIPFLNHFISWFNLDFGIESCFYNGMTAYGKVGLQFVFPVYIWIIIATIIIMCRYSSWLSHKIGNNVIQVLATLIILSYTKLLRTIVLVIKRASLSCNPPSYVWFVDGNVGYLQTAEHVLLFVIALCFMVLVSAFTLLLLFETLIDKYLTRFRLFKMRWFIFKHFCDAYNEPYKDTCRFWTGLLLLARIIIVIVVSLSSQPHVLLAITTITVLLLSLMVFLGGIYQNKCLNVLECVFLLSLCILSASYLAADRSEAAYIEYISFTLMFLLFIGIIVYHVYVRLRSSKSLRNVLKKIPKKRNDCKMDDLNKNLLKKDTTTSEVFLRRETLINDDSAI